MVMMAKSLAGGMPLSAVTAGADLMDAPREGGIGGTFGGNPLACAAALAVLDVIEREGLAERAEVIGGRVAACFERLAEEHDFLTRPRGLGAMRGLDVVDPETGDADSERAGRLVAEARQRGLLLMTASGTTIRTLMPLVIHDAELEGALAVLEQSAASLATSDLAEVS
jgi:4-aminobutyrate aminotransferase-like enzyme